MGVGLIHYTVPRRFLFEVEKCGWKA